MNEEEIIKKFGINPNEIGNRYRGYWIIDVIEEEEESGGAKIGDLCIKTRDGGYNPIDSEACKFPNFRGTSQDFFDCTYRYYYYKPLEEKNDQH